MPSSAAQAASSLIADFIDVETGDLTDDEYLDVLETLQAHILTLIDIRRSQS